ncbi:MAG TPA: branched-chain amino acid ABC transporter permease [Oscillospiraceae bacterium]|nr:branched-chain amino acid ABC transporter permease [Oscillospiraceae bacterium]HNW03989.1 branched-chain amino acid ABC transporter permease [Oscillospiraceae bacterium]
MEKFLSKMKNRYLLNTVLVAAFYGVLMLVIQFGLLNRYQTNMLIPVCYNIILAVSLNLSAGFLGQLPLGHAGFMSIGGYTAALITLALDLPSVVEFPIALIAGGLVAAVFGFVIGLPALRLRGDYLAIITLGFGEIIRVVITNLGFTGGAFGLSGIQKHTTLSIAFLCTVITIFAVHALMKSRHGRAILSIRENEIAAECSGIPTTYYKTITFTISAFFAGVAGGLYAHYLCILDPSNFGFMKSVEILIMVVLGGLGSMIGSITAAFGLTLLPELLRDFSDYRMVVYSLLLVIVMIFKPSGLFGTYDFSMSRLLTDLSEGDLFKKKTQKKLIPVAEELRGAEIAPDASISADPSIPPEPVESPEGKEEE